MSEAHKLAKKNMSHEERVAMCQKMDEELDLFIDQMRARNKELKKYEPENERSIDQIIEDLGNHPAFIKEIDYSKPLSDTVKGLIALKYESEDPTIQADNYREDGNVEFKKKKYRIAIDNYTEGIKYKSPERRMNAILYTNRAAAQCHLGNYRSAFNDCIFARKFQPDHVKAIVRGIKCCLEMKKYEHCITWCDTALMFDPEDEEVLQIRAKADKLQRAEERENRKRAAQERKDDEEEKELIKLIQGKGVKIAGLNKLKSTTKLSPLILATVESHHPSGAKVKVAENNVLHWPVLFFYPEHSQTDFIEAFDENSTFADHILHMFGDGVSPPSWDSEQKYKPETIQIYFENREEEKLYAVDINSTLLKTMTHKQFFVHGGTPSFILVVRESQFYTQFVKKYKL